MSSTHCTDLAKAGVRTSNFSLNGLNEMTIFRSRYASSRTGWPCIAAYKLVSRCWPSMIWWLADNCAPGAMLRVSPSAGTSQNINSPTGYPRYIESNRSRTFVAGHTNGRWRSGSWIEPVFTPLMRCSTCQDTVLKIAATNQGPSRLGIRVIRGSLRLVVVHGEGAVDAESRLAPRWGTPFGSRGLMDVEVEQLPQ